MIKSLIKKLWDSPTFTTWGSYLAKSLSLVLVLPIVLTRFSEESTAVWLLLTTFLSFQQVMDSGLSPTFIRFISYTRNGKSLAEVSKNLKVLHKLDNSTNKLRTDINEVITTLFRLYNKVSFSSLILMLFATFIVIKPLSTLNNPLNGWISWGIIIITFYVGFRGNLYSICLQGFNEIPILRRWDTLFSLLKIVSQFLVLILGGELLSLIIATQTWIIVKTIVTKYLAEKTVEKSFKEYNGSTNKYVISIAWPSIWRSAIGVAASYGLIQLSGIVYSQFGNIASVGSYLLAIRIIDAIAQFSQAPFYSKIPYLAELRAQGDKKKQVSVAKKGMDLSYISFLLPVALVGLFSDGVLSILDSKTEFVNPLLWGLLAIAYFFNRYGAMHIQLYSLTNHIIWHIANGFAGLLQIIATIALFPLFAVYSFPLGLIIGYAGFYSWYAAKYSYKEYKLRFLYFEKMSIVTFISLLLIIPLSMIIN